LDANYPPSGGQFCTPKHTLSGDLFIASSITGSPIGRIIRATVPHILTLLACLMVITYVQLIHPGGAFRFTGRFKGPGHMGDLPC
jgi:hypothetical protein